MKKTKTSLKQFCKHPDFMLIIVSFLFGIIFSMSEMGRDDVVIYSKLGNTIGDCWKWSVETYYTWSSRILINFVWAVILIKGRFIWMIYMAISMYVFQKAVLLLFSDGYKKDIHIFVIAVIMLFPFETLMTAGWIATTTSYFGPQAFALISLVPIKKVVNADKIKWYEIIFYSLCLIYGTNAEQMCIVVFGVYAIAVVYLFMIRKNNWIIWLLFAFSVVSMLGMFLCPGNWNRDISETAAWFPTFGMMDIIDKADIGISTTLKWLFSGNNILIIFMCGMMMLFIWEKYSEPLYRFISTIPVAMTCLLGPFVNSFSDLFPSASYAARDVDYYGEFTVASSGTGPGVIQFGLFLFLATCICVEIILLNDKIEGFIADISLVILGTASRCMMGFSPTVYASSTRTYTTLVVCLVAVLVHLYSSNRALLLTNDSQDVSQEFSYVLWGIIFVGLINLLFLVVTKI